MSDKLFQWISVDEKGLQSIPQPHKIRQSVYGDFEHTLGLEFCYVGIIDEESNTITPLLKKDLDRFKDQYTLVRKSGTNNHVPFFEKKFSCKDI
jgi:hypothetical protein